MKREWLWLVAGAVASAAAFALHDGCARRGSREAEAAALTAAGQIVASGNKGLLEAALEENRLLQEKYAEALRAAPGARPVVMARAVTAPAPAQVSVGAGEQLRLKVDEVLLQTVGGNSVLVGTASVEKADGTLVLRAPFSQETKLTAETPGRLSGWGVGPWLSAGSEGWAAGLVVAAPEVRVPWIGLRAEFSLGAGLGPGGKVAGSTQIVFRLGR